MPVVKLLVENGAKVNAADKDGRTSLHRAAKKNLETLAAYLIKKGADISLKDKHGHTPLDSAVQHKSEAVARLLRHHHAARSLGVTP